MFPELKNAQALIYSTSVQHCNEFSLKLNNKIIQNRIMVLVKCERL